jgi:hypothetical protein
MTDIRSSFYKIHLHIILFLTLSCYYENEEDLYGKLEEQVWTSDPITFTKIDNTDESLAENQDRITDNVWITRKLSGGQIYNAVVESSPDKEASPLGTEWAEGVINDYASLKYTTFRAATMKPKNAVGKTFVVHLIADNIYLSVRIISWSNNKLGGFSYERTSTS